MLGAVLTGVGVCLISPSRYGELLADRVRNHRRSGFSGLMYGPQAFFTELFSTECDTRVPLWAIRSVRSGWCFCADYRHHSVDGIRYRLGISVYCVASVLALISVMMLTETYQTNLNEAS